MMFRILCFGLVSANAVAASTDEWVTQWARSSVLSNLRAEFRSEKRSGELKTGEWSFRLVPFAQKISFRVHRRDTFLYEQKGSWDLSKGIGKEYFRDRESTRASGVITARPSGVLGYAELPSNSALFYWLGRSLPDLLSFGKWTVVSQQNGLQALFVPNPENENLILCLVLEPSESQPIREQRIYVTSEFAFPDRAQVRDLAGEIQVPEYLEGGTLFLRARITESRSVSDRTIPTQWRVSQCLSLPKEDSVVTLSDVQIDRNEQPLLSYDVEFPPGTKVVDATRGEGYYVRSDFANTTAEVLAEAQIDEILLMAGFSEPTGRDSSPEPGVVTACGANTLYAALSMLETPAKLASIVKALGIRESNQETSIAQIAQTAQLHGVPARCVKGSRELLKSALGMPVLLHVNVKRTPKDRQPVSHYYLVDGYDPEQHTVRVFDPPRFAFRARLEDLDRVWTGNAIIFDPELIASVDQEAILARRTRFWLSVIGSGFLILFGGAFIARCRRKPAIVLLMVSFGILGCERQGFGGGVSVRGTQNMNLGFVRSDGRQPIKHVFVVENNSGRAVVIDGVKKSCSCLSADVSKARIPPGGEVDVELTIGGGSLVGPQEARAVLVFDRPEIPPLSLSLVATVKPEYKVLMIPRIWAIPKEAGKKGEWVTRTFVVREFLPYDAHDAESTIVKSTTDDLTVVSLGPWKTNGLTFHGYSREADMTVKFRVAAKPRPFADAIDLEFLHRTDDSTSSAQEFACRLRLAIQG